MTVSIYWRVVQPLKGYPVTGTSHDMAILQAIWPRGIMKKGDIDKLMAMHASSRQKQSIWMALADALDNLPDGAEILVWGEY
jgi:hypothetical protein